MIVENDNMSDAERADLRKLLAAPAGTVKDQFARLAAYRDRWPAEYIKEYEAAVGPWLR